jgi:hypothetical protein
VSDHTRRAESAGQVAGLPYEFRAAREARRGAYYVLAAIPPLAAIGVVVSRYCGLPDAEPIAYTMLLVVGSLAALRWKVRIDEHGISRRWFYRWDFWPWEDLASGRIEKRHPYTLLDPRRPWWRRRLALEFMAPAEIRRAMELVNARYRLPDPPAIPEALDICYGFRRRALLDAKGICIHERGEVRQYLWNEVIRCHVTRMDPLRRDFKRLELSLPGHEFEFTLFQNGMNPSWRGATAAVVDEFLKRCIAADRIDVDVDGEKPVKRIDVAKDLERTRKAVRALFR